MKVISYLFVVAGFACAVIAGMLFRLRYLIVALGLCSIGYFLRGIYG